MNVCGMAKKQTKQVQQISFTLGTSLHSRPPSGSACSLKYPSLGLFPPPCLSINPRAGPQDSQPGTATQVILLQGRAAPDLPAGCHPAGDTLSNGGRGSRGLGFLSGLQGYHGVAFHSGNISGPDPAASQVVYGGGLLSGWTPP